ncbi:MAG: MmcB family DNA repair protein [Pseudomonadota bacterium]
MAPMESEPDSLQFPDDGRQSDGALAIRQGTAQLLIALNWTPLPEFTLPNGRRADIAALGPKGEHWIIEIKSSIADLRADHKWPEYRDYCDALSFAVSPEMPLDLPPGDCGLIVADRHGAEIIREAPNHPLSAARRKALTLRYARAAVNRLARGGETDAWRFETTLI